jgi:hypothetical protein
MISGTGVRGPHLHPAPTVTGLAARKGEHRMARSAKHTACWLVALMMAVGPSATRANTQDDAKEEARKRFDRAMGLVEDGQYAEALIEFKRSYELLPHHAVLYNLGQTYILLAKPVEAAQALRRYLEEGGTAIKAKRRAEVEREIARQKARIATLELKVQPEGAVVRVDETEVGKAPLGAPVLVGIGEHLISATAEGHEPAQEKLTVAGEDRRTIELVLKAFAVKLPAPAVVPPAVPEPAPVKPAPAAESPTSITPPAALSPPETSALPMAEAAAKPPLDAELSAPEQSSSTAERSGGWNGGQIAGGVMLLAGVASFVVAGICWETASSRHDKAASYWNMGGPEDDLARSFQSQAQDYATAATVTVIAGSALTVGGMVLIIAGTAGSEAPASGTQARLVPVVGPGFAGFATRGTW